MFSSESGKRVFLRSETQSELEGELGLQIGVEIDFGGVIVFSEFQHLGV